MQAKGLSPECIRLCTSNLRPVVKDESHSVHDFDLLCLCTLICLANDTFDSKVLPQISHAHFLLSDECE